VKNSLNYIHAHLDSSILIEFYANDGGRGRERKKGVILNCKNVYSQNRFHLLESTNLVHIMYMYI
jgi:hypothetical protein